MSIERMSWFSSSFVTSALPPGSTNVSSSKTSLRPWARSRAVGKRQSVRRRGSTRMIRSLPRSAIRSPPGRGPGSVTILFGSGLDLLVVVVGASLGFADRCTRAPVTAIAASTNRATASRDLIPVTVRCGCEGQVSTHYARGVDGPARRERLADSRLYLVLETRPHGDDPRPLLDAALRGGVDVVQLREKGLEDDALMAAAAPFRAACDQHGALLRLNDRPDLVAACGADGVHVGRSDRPVAEARSLVVPERLVGLSVSTLDELGDVRGADSVGVTAFPTPTKQDAVAGGLELLRAAAETLTLPWFAIGGIELSNVAEAADAGAPGAAVVRAIRDAGDPEAAARELRAALDR